MTQLSLVIPCYNEGPTLPELVARTAAALAACPALEPGAFELLLVDNASSDETPQVLAGLVATCTYPFLRTLRVKSNRGYGHGLLSGLRAATSDVLATSHADLQCDPADVFRAWQIYQQPSGDAGTAAPPVLVKGVRHGRPLGARVVSRLFDAAALPLLGRRLHETNAQPKVFGRELLDALTDPPLDFRFDLYLVLRALERGYTMKTLDVRFPPRVHGESHWSASFRGRWGTFAGFLGYMARYRRGR